MKFSLNRKGFAGVRAALGHWEALLGPTAQWGLPSEAHSKGFLLLTKMMNCIKAGMSKLHLRGLGHLSRTGGTGLAMSIVSCEARHTPQAACGVGLLFKNALLYFERDTVNAFDTRSCG